MGKGNELEQLNKQMFYAMAYLAMTQSVLSFICKIFGIDTKPNPIDGYVPYYLYSAGDGIYIHGYRHPVTKEVKLFASWDWRSAVTKEFKTKRPYLNHKMAMFFINHGRKVERAMQHSNNSLGLDNNLIKP